MGRRATPQERLGKRIRQLRLANELSQMDMVRNFEFSLSHFQKQERGDLDPRLSTLRKLAKAFKVSVSELVAGQ